MVIFEQGADSLFSILRHLFEPLIAQLKVNDDPLILISKQLILLLDLMEFLVKNLLFFIKYFDFFIFIEVLFKVF